MIPDIGTRVWKRVLPCQQAAGDGRGANRVESPIQYLVRWNKLVADLALSRLDTINNASKCILLGLGMNPDMAQKNARSIP